MIGTPGRTDDCKLGRMLSSLSRQRMRLLDCSGNVGLLDGKIADKVRGKDGMWDQYAHAPRLTAILVIRALGTRTA